MKVYAKNKTFIVDMEDGSKLDPITQAHGRFHFAEDYTVVEDVLLDVQYKALTAELKNEAGAAIGAEDAVLDYLSVFIG